MKSEISNFEMKRELPGLTYSLRELLYVIFSTRKRHNGTVSVTSIRDTFTELHGPLLSLVVMREDLKTLSKAKFVFWTVNEGEDIRLSRVSLTPLGLEEVARWRDES